MLNNVRLQKRQAAGLLDRQLADYEYRLPAERIAQQPAVPRDRARLLVYDRQTNQVADDTFEHLLGYLPPRAVLVLNQTKVIPARIEATKETGGRVRLLILRWKTGQVTVLADRPLEPGQRLTVGRQVWRIERRVGAHWILRTNLSVSRLLRLLDQRGRAPVPPYIKHRPLTARQLRSQYQTVFARRPGSVAAPTASLHFTTRLLKKLRAAGIRLEYVTLHVNLGTFAPLGDEQLRRGKLHQEEYEISAAAAARLNRDKKSSRPIIAVGTTVARTLESAARRGRLRSGTALTDIFIRPGYRWRFVDGLITNFHVPRSSLLMLVASLIGRSRLLSLYRRALRRGYRFFSFGDGMLIR